MNLQTIKNENQGGKPHAILQFDSMFEFVQTAIDKVNAKLKLSTRPWDNTHTETHWEKGYRYGCISGSDFKRYKPDDKSFWSFGNDNTAEENFNHMLQGRAFEEDVETAIALTEKVMQTEGIKVFTNRAMERGRKRVKNCFFGESVDMFRYLTHEPEHMRQVSIPKRRAGVRIMVSPTISCLDDSNMINCLGITTVVISKLLSMYNIPHSVEQLQFSHNTHPYKYDCSAISFPVKRYDEPVDEAAVMTVGMTAIFRSIGFTHETSSFNTRAAKGLGYPRDVRDFKNIINALKVNDDDINTPMPVILSKYVLESFVYKRTGSFYREFESWLDPELVADFVLDTIKSINEYSL